MVMVSGCGHASETLPKPVTSQPALTVPFTEIRSIRVLLLDETFVAEAVFEGACDVVDPETGDRLAASVPGPAMLVSFSEEGIWLFRIPLPVPLKVIDLVPCKGQPIGLRLDGHVRYYRGRLRFVCPFTESGSVVNVVDIEDYLAPVVAAELDRRFHQETFRAQAIVARTYAWYRKQTGRASQAWDVTATESSQVYPGLARVKQVPQAARAVHDTQGLVCTWDSPEGERIFCTYYSSVCGGWTQSVEAIRRHTLIPPLAGNVRCDYCQDAPGFYWGPVQISKADVTRQLRDCYDRFEAMGPIERVEVKESTPAGRPVRFALIDADGESVELESENLRLALDPTGRKLQSTFFELVDAGDQIVFQHGRGFGHGVGMCQYGAEGLARQGVRADEILRFYYPHSKLRRAY